MPTMAAQFSSMAEQAIRARQTHVDYLDALLAVELEEREKKTVVSGPICLYPTDLRTSRKYDFVRDLFGHSGKKDRTRRACHSTRARRTMPRLHGFTTRSENNG